MSQLVYDYESLALKLGVGFLFSWVLCVGQLLEIIGQFNSAASITALFEQIYNESGENYFSNYQN